MGGFSWGLRLALGRARRFRLPMRFPTNIVGLLNWPEVWLTPKTLHISHSAKVIKAEISHY